MRIGTADLLVILSIVAFTLGAATIINTANPTKPVSILTVAGLALVMILLEASKQNHDAKKAYRFYNDAIRKESKWPIYHYITLGFLVLGLIAIGILTDIRVTVGLGMSCGYAIASTLARRQPVPNEAVAVVRGEVWRWEDAVYHLIDFDGETRLYPKSGNCYSTAGSILDWPVVPETDVDKVRAILAAKQENQVATDNTDAHG